MTSTMSWAEERVINDLAYIAGGEDKLERAIRSFVQVTGRTPTGDELLDHVADTRIAELTDEIARRDHGHVRCAPFARGRPLGGGTTRSAARFTRRRGTPHFVQSCVHPRGGSFGTTHHFVILSAAPDAPSGAPAPWRGAKDLLSVLWRPARRHRPLPAESRSFIRRHSARVRRGTARRLLQG
jgi:hypothetical protein